MKAILHFLNNMDARAARAVGVSIGLFLAVALILLLGKTTAIFDEDDAPLIIWMQANADSPWALPATILVFTLAGLLGAPQFALIAGAVVAFGPMRGALNAWIATLTAATFMFWVGRAIGAETLKRYGGETVNRLSRFIGRNGFVASLTVRFVPLAPAIMVNMAAGVTHMRYWVFAAGTALGVIPKIAFVAFAGQGFLAFIQGGNWLLALVLVVAAGAWLAVMLAARNRLRGAEHVEEFTAQEPASPPATTPKDPTPSASPMGLKPSTASDHGADALSPIHKRD